MSKKIAVILSGCGYLDGSEINEVIFTLLAISKNHAKFEAFAPNIEQKAVIDHTTKQIMDHAVARNVLLESARLVRGSVHDIVELSAEHFDALIIPGGFGVASNLSTLFQSTDNQFTVNTLIENAVMNFYKLRKPIGAMCIAPLIIAKALSSNNVKNLTMTTGKKNEVLSTMPNVIQQKANADEIVVDRINKVVTTPAFMLDAPLYEIAEGIEKLVRSVIDM